IMAVFPESPVTAVRAAVGMQRATVDFNRDHPGLPDIDIGVAINTGTIMLGIVGEKERIESTVISDVVNVASRLEGMNKEFGSKVTISGAVYREIHEAGFTVRLLGRIKVRGRDEAVAVYEVLDAEPEEVRREKLAAAEGLQQALELLHTGRSAEAEEAAKVLRALQQRYPRDRAVGYYRNRIKVSGSGAV
ncbi:MAG TPA: adenylate/guanylate cyclase domain-containing protein, partial [Sediminispirochaeta sp.]|nr:adenylate/guanylate cyclase domain-containing protein [Sediminispirochaeta sp.]